MISNRATLVGGPYRYALSDKGDKSDDLKTLVSTEKDLLRAQYTVTLHDQETSSIAGREWEKDQPWRQKQSD
jgi:hypothetical protein